MNTIRVSATSARNNFFELLHQVTAGAQVIIEKDKKEVAVLSQKRTKTNWKALLKASKAVHGILKDASAEEISPIKKKNAWKRIGKW